uniref:Uncharacterized protein n=1 Tax=Rousettus aegyptiacus TaxID=9407 RepID=A0A7J8CHL7_ROUAE|nr:hypothetical protein HJG63_008925 [Rousettus aegyptiacus]
MVPHISVRSRWVRCHTQFLRPKAFFSAGPGSDAAGQISCSDCGLVGFSLRSCGFCHVAARYMPPVTDSSAQRVLLSLPRVLHLHKRLLSEVQLYLLLRSYSCFIGQESLFPSSVFGFPGSFVSACPVASTSLD